MAVNLNNPKDMEKANFQQHPSKDANTERFVADETAHGKLDTIAAGLGTSNTTTTTDNISVPLANTEQSYTLPANTKKFIIRARGNSRIQLAYSVGLSGTTFRTVDPGSDFTDTNFYTNQTIYFQLSKAGDVVELVISV